MAERGAADPEALRERTFRGEPGSRTEHTVTDRPFEYAVRLQRDGLRCGRIDRFNAWQ